MIYDWLSTQDFSEKRALECGAHNFSDTHRLSKFFKEVLSFEANPNTVANDLPSNVIFEAQALSTFTGYTSFYLDENPEGDAGASSLLPSAPFYMEYVKKESQVNVPCISLYDALRKHQIPNIDFFWLDMEGFELEFLKGTDLSQVSYIYTEVNFQRFRQEGCLYSELKEFLENQGFVEAQKWTRDESWNGDVLFVKN